MAVNNFHFKLDIEKEDHIPKFKLKQYDTAIFYASLYKNGLPYQFEGEKIKMFVKKADGTIVYQEDNITIQNEEVKINVKNQSLTASGLTYAELELRSTSGQVTTATFLFEVKEKVGSDKAIESITDICTLEKFDRYVGQAKKELDKFKQDLYKLEDLVDNKDKLEGQNTEAKVNIKELEKILEQANNIVSNEGKKVTGNNIISESSNGYIQDIKLTGKTLIVNSKNEEVLPGTEATLKSVGDDVDEIVILSRKEDGNICNIETDIVGAYSYGDYKVDSAVGSILIRCEPNTKYYVNAENNDRSVITTYTRKPQRDDKSSKVSEDHYIITGANDKYLLYYLSSDVNVHPIKNVYIGKTPFKGDFNHQSNKKKILYCDTDTKTWEKPILREWDSIEQRSYGKYFYYKRSNIRTLKGGVDENWSMSSSGTNQKLFILQLEDLVLNKNNEDATIICDKLNSVSSNYHWNNDGNLITVGFNTKQVRLKLTGIDSVEGLKAWLQSNNVTIVYQLEQEKVYECLNISVRAFYAKTLVYIDSGVIESELEYYIPSSFVSSDNSICEKIDILDLINFDINSIKLPGLDLNESLNKEYFNINRGMVTDFNTAKEEGKYFVYNINGIPHAPFTGALYGLLEVNFTNDSEILQRLVTTDGKIFTRFLNSRNIWSDWVYTPTTQDFQTGTVQGKHYIKFPNGVMIQWGDLVLNFPGSSNSVKGFVYFPLSFKSDFIFTGSLARNNWTGYSETIAVLAEDNSGRGFVEARCLDSSVYPTSDKSVTINWIAIGRY